MNVKNTSYTRLNIGAHSPRRMRVHSSSLLVSGLCLLGLLACSADGGPTDSVDDSSSTGSVSGEGNGSSVGVGTGGAPAVSSGGSTSTGSKSSINLKNSGGSGDGGTAAVCASTAQETKITPVDMYIMFDRSSSMNNDSVPTLWEEATTALVGFLQAPGSADFGVALRFFPDDDPVPGCIGTAPAGNGNGNGNDDVFGAGGGAAAAGGTTAAPEALICDVASCAAPLVPVGNLLAETGAADLQETALVTAIQNKAVLTSSQGTPTFAALSGALTWGLDRLTIAPDRAPIVVLVTDGDPNGCGTVDEIVALAESGFNAGLITYVIGLEGSSDATIQRIATGGGTEGIFIGGADSNAGQDLIDALDAIRGEALDCEFPTPTQEGGVPVDTSLVNIKITQTDLSEVEILKVPSEAECSGGTNWYYTDVTETMIALCPTACDIVKTDDNARIDIELGCETKPFT